MPLMSCTEGSTIWKCHLMLMFQLSLDSAAATVRSPNLEGSLSGEERTREDSLCRQGREKCRGGYKRWMSPLGKEGGVSN